MNYLQASNMVLKYRHLLNTKFKTKTISALVIAPANHEGVERLMYNLSRQLTSAHRYDRYGALDVVIVFDYTEGLTPGVIDKASLTALLPRILAEEPLALV